MRAAINTTRHIMQSEGTLYTVISSDSLQNPPVTKSLKRRFIVPIHGNSERAFPVIHSVFIGSLQIPPA